MFFLDSRNKLSGNNARHTPRRTPKTYHRPTRVALGTFLSTYVFFSRVFRLQFSKTVNKRLSALKTKYSGLSIIRQISADRITAGFNENIEFMEIR